MPHVRIQQQRQGRRIGGEAEAHIHIAHLMNGSVFVLSHRFGLGLGVLVLVVLVLVVLVILVLLVVLVFRVLVVVLVFKSFHAKQFGHTGD